MKPILSICIPIYNRLSYLEKQLSRLLVDKDLFKEKIQLVISDNCSDDDIESCCKKYENDGLRLVYHRNNTNLGSNGNFEWCFNNAEGKFIWLLGSDDIPVQGCIRRVLTQLECRDYGLLHLSMKPLKQSIIEYNDNNEIVVAINFWITFMSSNIVARRCLKDVNLDEYKSTWLIQVPVYLTGCFSSSVNALMDIGQPFERDNDALNNGGYHFFEVFITNLFCIYNSFVKRGLLSEKSFARIKRIEFKEFLARNIVSVLIFKRNNNYDNKNAWRIICGYYKYEPYALFYLTVSIIKYVLLRIYNFMKLKK